MGVMDTTFRVRFQATQANGDIAALVVEDRGGSYYLFSGGRLQVRFDREAWTPRVGELLQRASFSWLPVECDAQLPLAELATYIARQQAPRQPAGSAAFS